MVSKVKGFNENLDLPLIKLATPPHRSQWKQEFQEIRDPVLPIHAYAHIVATLDTCLDSNDHLTCHTVTHCTDLTEIVEYVRCR